MSAKHPEKDRNFDDLAKRFQKNIYDSMKGQLRLAVLKRDFSEHLTESCFNVLDAGAGQGQWAMEMLRQGHKVVLTDISSEMLMLAQRNIGEQLGKEYLNSTNFLQSPLQKLVDHFEAPFDLITCHAVMEWLEEPHRVFEWLTPLLKPNGYLSIIFYNKNGLVFKNLLRANYRKVLADDFRGSVGSLTPLNPLVPNEVLEWARLSGYELICQSGIRVFHDYVLDKKNYQKDHESVEKLELAFSQQEPYRDLGRYMHILLRKEQ